MLKVSPITAFADNYIWLLSREGSSSAVVVDPGDAPPVIAVLEQKGLELSAILITHHHMDHTGGIRRLLLHYPDATIYGPAGEHIPANDQKLQEGDRVCLEELGVNFEVLDVPGHTTGHIAYFGAGALFCGDALFSVGCGRLFGGTPEQMSASLAKMAALPSDTKVYCAHEYTLDNIGFAKWVEADNPDLLARETEAKALRQRGEPTVPSSLEQELRVNPFLRGHVLGVKQSAEEFAGRKLDSAAEIFGAVREWKDSRYD